MCILNAVHPYKIYLVRALAHLSRSGFTSYSAHTYTYTSTPHQFNYRFFLYIYYDILNSTYIYR